MGDGGQAVVVVIAQAAGNAGAGRGNLARDPGLAAGGQEKATGGDACATEGNGDLGALGAVNDQGIVPHGVI